jgi:putative hydrolase of the HAD superfamily
MRCVTLDALGTLVTFEPPAPHLVAGLAAHGVEVDEATAARAVRAEIAFYRTHHDDAGDEAGLTDLRRRCAAVLAAELPARAAALGDDALVEVMMGALRFRAFPEVPAVLDELRARGLALVVASNWDVSLHEVLDRTGLAGSFDAVVTSAELGVAKPDPAFLRHAVALVGADPSEALHVGDTVEEDVAGAQAAGLRAVLIDREGGLNADVPVLPSLAGLPGLLH